MKLAWSEEKQKFSKTPIDLKTGLLANCDGMGVSYAVAVQHLNENTVLNYRHPDTATMRLGLIDCDHCVSPNGSISSRIQKLLRYLDTYAEYSVSDGIHMLCWLDAVPPDGHKDRAWDMECYWQARSIPITGNRVILGDWESPNDLQPRTLKYVTLHKDRFPDAWLPAPAALLPQPASLLSQEQILSRLFREHDGEKWADIYAGNWQGHYESPSDADLALLMKFAFYTGRDREMMESMFSECPLSKILARGTVEEPTLWRTPKWANQNYRKRTLDAAITRTTTIYTPKQQSVSAQGFYLMRRRQIHENREQK